MKRMKWLALPLALMLVVLAGCEAVAGFDINKALVQTMNPVSSESKQSLSVELVPVEGRISAEDRKIIDLINSFSLSVDSAKTENATNASVKGTIGFDGSKLPFHLSVDDKALALQIEGADKPIYISLDTPEIGMGDFSSYQEQMTELSTQAAEFVIKHLPNPSSISVKRGNETVNGETLNLTNLSVELRGDELLELVKPFLSNVVNDEQGMKELIETLFDTVSSVMALDQDASMAPMMSKEMIAEITAEVQKTLKQFVADYDKEMAELIATTPELATILGKDTVLKMSIYFDSKLNVRKEQMELSIAMPKADDVPIQAVKVRVDSEIWNVDGKVSVDKVDVSSGVLNVMDETLTPGQILRNFKPGSTVHQFLRNEAQITHKYVMLDPDNEYYSAISKNNTTFVPLRYISEQFDAEVKWTAGSDQITIIDDITGGEIVVSKNSKNASVNGQTVTLSQPIFVDKNGTTYVPLRFIAESLGATVSYDEGWITMERQ